jgi:hypothetical protein
LYRLFVVRQTFCEALLNQDFQEIHTPKLILTSKLICAICSLLLLLPLKHAHSPSSTALVWCCSRERCCPFTRLEFIRCCLSVVLQLFREALLSQDFQEIHTPKLIAGASEGGAAVFR